MMTVNMKDIYKNPFRIGDKVMVKRPVLRAFPRSFEKYLGIEYAVVQRIDNYQVMTDVDSDPAHFEHFEFYREEKDMNQQEQPKTKRVPFTHELWEKWKDNGGEVIYKPTGKQVLQLAYFPEADHRYRYVYLTTLGSCTQASDIEYLELLLPVITKRIPFNPELKDAKVFYGETELTEWFQAKTGVVCGTHTVNSFGDEYTSLYHPNDLEMEIET